MTDTVFLLDKNLGLTVDDEPWPRILSDAGIKAVQTTDLPHLDRMAAKHEPDVVFLPIADFHRLVAKGDDYYRGFAIATSKFTGTTNLPSVLVVRKDDPAKGLQDLEGSKYGYINESCSSSYFPPAILLQQHGRKLDEFLEIIQTKAWQGQVDAVVAQEVRATMVPEDVWRTYPQNAQNTKVIGRYDVATPGLIVARHARSSAGFAIPPAGAFISFAKASQRALASLRRTVLSITAAVWRQPSMSSSLKDAPSTRMSPTSAFAAPLPKAMSGHGFCPFAPRLTASRASVLAMSPSGNSTERFTSWARSASTAAHSAMR
jgi:hypothetical protein